MSGDEAMVIARFGNRREADAASTLRYSTQFTLANLRWKASGIVTTLELR